jgi:hypothetical protein
VDLNALFKELAQEPYEARGILHSEVALIIYAVRKLGIERIIESGRARAQSTYLLGKYLPDVGIHSVELRGGEDEEFGRRRVSLLENVTTYGGDGDGAEMVPVLARVEKPTAILLDGPKGAAAVSILKECFGRPHVRVGFIHDMRRLDHGEPSPHRADAIARLPNHKFSDDPALVAGSSWMDAKVVEAGGPCGPQHEAVFGSYGPTLGVFLNPQQ